MDCLMQEYYLILRSFDINYGAEKINLISKDLGKNPFSIL